MKKAPSHEQLWTDDVLRIRAFGYPGCWIAWAAITLLLLGCFIYYDLQSRSPFDFVGSLFVHPTSPSIVFVAKNDVPVFTVLTKDNIDAKQDSQTDNNQIEKQKEALYNRITLRHYEKGEEIHLADLGPKVSPSLAYQGRILNAASAITWIHAGDTVELVIVNTFCSQQSNASTASPLTCMPQVTTKTLSNVLMDVVILRTGEPGKDGIMPLLVAIPIEKNKEVLSLLDREIAHIIVYPEVNTGSVTYIPNDSLFAITSLCSSSWWKAT